jgi:non-heme chloroperoxidase
MPTKYSVPDLINRCDVLAGSLAIACGAWVQKAIASEFRSINSREITGASMAKITTKDGTEIFYKDWGSGQPIAFHHGWPLSSDDWDAATKQLHRPCGLARGA